MAAADIWDWSRLGIPCLLLEEGIAWKEGVHIARCFGRHALLGCSTSRLLHPFFAPFLAAKWNGEDIKGSEV